MKKIITVFAAAALLLTTTAFATDNRDVSAKVKAAFAKNFSGATAVSWELKDGFYFASFTVNNVKTDAAYNAAGELLATSRKVTFEQLPMAVSLSLSEKYADYQFANSVTELTFEGSTQYQLTGANNKQIVNLKVSANGDISVEKKTKI